MSFPRIVVIGAGLQGSSLALALASRGMPVELLERNSFPMSATVLRAEGKIHLGFIYALDRTGETQRQMLRGALSFGALLETWCGTIDWASLKSDGFRYAIMPDSLESRERLEASYRELSKLLSETVSSQPLSGLNLSRDYLGEPLTWFWREFQGGREVPRVPGVQLLETQEASVDTRILRELMSRKLIENPLIQVRCATKVLEARRTGAGFRLLIENETGRSECSADIVLNCSWESRAILDRSVGLPIPLDAENFRVKHQVLVRPKRSHDLYPVTMVQGPYGDVVPFRDGVVYLSWYPLGRTYFASRPPPQSELEDKERAMQIAHGTIDILGEMFPSLENAEVLSSLPGIILAQGDSDVDDPQSGLHVRSSIGFLHQDGWWSVNPGKLTTAPMIAELTTQELDRIL